MTRVEFLLALDEMLSFPPGTLKGNEVLENVECWDSLMVVNFLATVDEKFSVALPPKKVAACKTIDNLIALLPDYVK